MATYTITTDSKKAQVLSAANSTWTLDPNVTVEVYGITALTVKASATKSTVNVLGELICSGESVSTGIGVLAAGVTINIGADARIFATAGIQSVQAATVNNKGLVAGVEGISVNGGSITNSGVIISSHSAAVQLYADGTITNLEDGQIFGAMAGSGTGFHTYINKGFVGASTYALSDGDGASKTINTGTISGDVMLGDGDDVFDTSGGEMRGTVEGGAGDDTYIISSYLDIFEDLGFGTDTVKSSASYTLAAHLERLMLRGSANINGTGNELSNTLYGNAGNNILKGAAGDDLIKGGSGNDVLIGGMGTDQLFGDDGADTASYAGAAIGVFASLLTPSGNTNDAMGDTYSSIENLTGSSYADTLIGNTVANLISGGADDDTLFGDFGNDTLIGGAGADQLFGNDDTDTASYAGATKGVLASLLTPSGNTNDAMGDTYSSIENLTGSRYADTLTGDTGANLISGDAGNDTFYGGLGNDTLLGGAGADRLSGDDGTDTASYADATKGVVASLLAPSRNTNDAKGDTYSSIENLTGSSYADTLTGNTGANLINGGAGDDTLLGGAGSDKLYGSTGTDTASYAGATKGVVASLLTPSSNTNDAKGDTYSSIENLTGSSYADTLTGNTGANLISGGAGNDTLLGGAGSDKLYGSTGTDTASYAGATKGVVASLLTPSGNTNDAKGDTYSSIENLTGSSYADTLTGNTGANRIDGGSGNDTLYGGLGKDVLIGGAGLDMFVFNTKLGSINIDTVDDFVVKDDTFRLDDDIFTKAGKLGSLATSAFWAGTKAHDADDRIIYDKATGKLFYDADGNASGAAVQFALLDKGISLTAADFYLIA